MSAQSAKLGTKRCDIAIYSSGLKSQNLKSQTHCKKLLGGTPKDTTYSEFLVRHLTCPTERTMCSIVGSTQEHVNTAEAHVAVMGKCLNSRPFADSNAIS